MIIKEIYIDGFGIFHNYGLKGLTKGVNIIEGENEAGKSTFLNFIRYTFFGYPNRTSDRYEPLNSSAAHGGRIVAELANGKQAVFERAARGKGGKIQLHYEGTVSADPSQWSLLLGNANLQLFQSVYGFTLYELIGFDNLENSGIDDKIFSLGIGVSNVSIGEVENKLITKAENIYKKGGNKQDIPRLLKSIEEKKVQIASVQGGLQDYEKVMTNIYNIDGEIGQIKNNLKNDIAKKELLSNCLKCYDSYISILQIDRDLINAPTEFICPENAEQQLRSLELQADSIAIAIGQLKSNDSQDGIEQLQKDIENIEVNEQVLVHEDLITQLNEQLEKYQSTIEENRKTQNEINKLNNEIEENLKKISSEWSEDDVKNFSNLVAHKDAIQQFETQWNEFTQFKISIVAKQEANQGQLVGKNRNIPYYLGITIPLLLSIAAFFYSVPFGITFIGIALLVAIFFLVSRKPKKNGIDNELTGIEGKIDQLKTLYNNYLQMQLKLQKGLSFGAVYEIFNLIESTNRLLTKKEEYQEIIHERDGYIKQFASLVLDLQQKYKIESGVIANDFFIREAKRELNTAKQSFESKLRLNKVLEAKQREENRLLQQLAEITSKSNQLFKDVGAIDRNDYLNKYNSESRARELIADRKNHINTIEKIIGFGKVDELFSFLDGKDRFNLEFELQQLQEKVDNDNALVLEQTTEKGRLETQLSNLVSNSTLSQLETELEVERTKLMECYKHWLKSRMAFQVLSVIKKKYEMEKQPEVIRFSSEVFSDITSGRYKRIQVPLDSREVLIFDHQERTKRIDQLSRGTKEQLLISLRLGLIQEYEKNKEPLPIVLDDVFVNFDSCRTKNISDAIQKFAENRQVIIFTCHPNLATNFSAPVNKISLVPFTLEEDTLPKELLSQKIQVN